MKKITLFLIVLGFALSVKAQNQSLNFDGIDDYVDLGDNFGYEITDTFSVEAWIKFDTPGLQQVVSKLGIEDNTFRGWGLQITSAGRLSGYISTEFFNDYIFTTGTSDFLFDNNWHHVGMTYDGAGNLLLYVDGMPEPFTSSGGGTVTNISTTSHAHIGNYAGNGAPSEYFFGNIDDVRIWDTARTAQEIEDNYLTELSGNEAGLVGYYKLDDDQTVCDVIDCSPSGFHGIRDGVIGVNDGPQFSTDIPTLTDVECGVDTQCQLSTEDFGVANIQIFPNPTQGVLSFSGDTSGIKSIRLMNALGKTILQPNLTVSNSITLTNLPAGMYFLQFEMENNTVVSKKVIKN